jgi:hypothetical protein
MHEELDQVLDELAATPVPAPDAQQALEARLTELLQQKRGKSHGKIGEITDATHDRILAAYKHLGAECRPRWRLLALLAGAREAADLELLAELLCTDPPLDSVDANLVLAPLLQHADYDAAKLFPRLLDAIEHLQVAPAVLDLANFLARTRRVPKHPAADHAPRLTRLLEGLTRRLVERQRQPPTDAAALQKIQRQIGESVALACSACDALGLIGDSAALPALAAALAVAHRRIRVEAAAALARLGDDDGVRALAAMAAYPITRLRAIHYAEELGVADFLDPQFTTLAARAEAELACWLAEPAQFGTPPTSLEPIDNRTQFWPSYESPVECFLFRFSYHLPQGQYANLGIAGPLVHAFRADLTELSPEDAYAAFAGWQAEHADIYEIAAEHFTPAHAAATARIARRLEGESFTNITPVALGGFFGEMVLIATARRDGYFGALAAGSDEAAWFPRGPDSPRPIGPLEAWNIWKGRRLLRTFNTPRPMLP